MLRLCCLVTAVLAAPALASNVVGTFGMTDTTSATMGAAGSVLLDARAVASPSGVSSGVFLVGSLTDGLELGLGAGAAGSSLGLSAAAVAPWLKARLFAVEQSTVSVLLGTSMDLMVFANSTFGSELTLTNVFGWGSIDSNVGVGFNLSTAQPLGHLSLCSYVNLPVSMTLLLEVFGYLSSINTPRGAVGERVGLSYAGFKHVSFDASLGLVEDPWGAQLLTWIPQIGATATF